MDTSETLDPIHLRLLLAKRFDAQGELPWGETDLGRLLSLFRRQRQSSIAYAGSEEDREEMIDWKFTFVPGDYSLPERRLTLAGGNFSATCWAGANLAGTDARGCLWDEATFTFGWRDDGKRVECNCSRMDFSGYQAGEYERTGKGMRFYRVNLQGSCWRLAKVVGSSFDCCDLSGSDLRGAWFINCDFSSSDLSGIRCDSARFDGCLLPKAFQLQGATIHLLADS